MIDHTLPPSWQALTAEFEAPYMRALDAFLESERAAGAQVFPADADRFRALELTPLDQVRVVILGQDPYHGEGQAHGLSFSVREGVRTPPSLVNIYKELETDLGIPRASHGMLDHWAAQGVLLLNAVLSVRMGEAASHQKRGWERFTDAVIAAVNAQPNPVVFLLWGAYAQKKAAFVDDVTRCGEAGGGRHLVIQSAHPSPLAARTGFFGSRPFSRANAFLETHGRTPIDWALPETDG
jgi:uracil-DNA glycosylase